MKKSFSAFKDGVKNVVRKSFLQILYKAHADFVGIRLIVDGKGEHSAKGAVVTKGSFSPYASYDSYKQEFRALGRSSHPDLQSGSSKMRDLNSAHELLKGIKLSPVLVELNKRTNKFSWSLKVNIESIYQGLKDFMIHQNAGYEQIKVGFDVDAAEAMFPTPGLNYAKRKAQEEKVKTKDKADIGECMVVDSDNITDQEVRECKKKYKAFIEDEAHVAAEDQIISLFDNFIESQVRSVLSDGQANVAFLNVEYNKVYRHEIEGFCQTHGSACNALGEDFVITTAPFKDALIGELLPGGE